MNLKASMRRMFLQDDEYSILKVLVRRYDVISISPLGDGGWTKKLRDGASIEKLEIRP